MSGKTFDNINPSTEEVITKIQEGEPADIDLAVNAARNAFDKGPWRSSTAYERGRTLFKIADLLEKYADELAGLEALDNGKPKKIARAVDIDFSIAVFRYYAGYADKVHGKVIPMATGDFCYTVNEPVGVCAQIIPWNFPITMAAWKLAPALAMGNTIVLKPAEQTPLSAIRLGEILMEAGLPDGVVNIVPGFGKAGAHLAQHPLVDKVAFTGSTEVGYEIMRNSHKHNLKRITLELGGKSPNIIMDDANIDLAIQQATMGLFFNNGQCCVAGSRTFVHEKVYDEFVHRATEIAKSQKIGNPFDDSTDQGPLVDIDQRKKYEKYVSHGKHDGAKLLCGGHTIKGKGYFVEPTVFSDVTDDMVIAKEEIFGPVMSVLKFRNIDEVIERANRSQYGLGAGVVTENLDNALKLAHGLRVGQVYVNCYNAFSYNTPFGGFKDSGIGRELGEAGLQQYSETKTIVIKKLH